MQVFALGIVSIFDQVLDEMPEAEREGIFKAYIESLDEKPAQYRQDADKLAELAEACTSADDLIPDASGSEVCFFTSPDAKPLLHVSSQCSVTDLFAILQESHDRAYSIAHYETTKQSQLPGKRCVWGCGLLDECDASLHESLTCVNFWHEHFTFVPHVYRMYIALLILAPELPAEVHEAMSFPTPHTSPWTYASDIQT